MAKKFDFSAFTTQDNQLKQISSDLLVYNNDYERYEGEQYSDMVESIRQNGILQPLIVRPIEDGKYCILAGNNRRFCGEAAGLTVFPCIVKENLSDDEAQMYIDETNIYQRGFKNLKLSKQAEVIARRHEQMFDEEKLREIQEEIARMNGDDYDIINEKGSKLQQVGDEYGLGKSTIARLLRIDSLVKELKPYVDNGSIAVRTAVEISYLPEYAQVKIADMKKNGYPIGLKQAAMMRQLAKSDELSENMVTEVIKGYHIKKAIPQKRRSVIIRPAIIRRYFSANYDDKNINDTIEKALRFYYEKRREEERDSNG